MMNMLFLAYPFEFNPKKNEPKMAKQRRRKKRMKNKHTNHPDTDVAEMYRAKKAHQPC